MPCPATKRAAVLLIETDSISVIGPKSTKTTKLYDRTSDQITLDEVERIVI